MESPELCRCSWKLIINWPYACPSALGRLQLDRSAQPILISCWTLCLLHLTPATLASLSTSSGSSEDPGGLWLAPTLCHRTPVAVLPASNSPAISDLSCCPAHFRNQRCYPSMSPIDPSARALAAVLGGAATPLAYPSCSLPRGFIGRSFGPCPTDAHVASAQSGASSMRRSHKRTRLGESSPSPGAAVRPLPPCFPVGGSSFDPRSPHLSNGVRDPLHPRLTRPAEPKEGADQRSRLLDSAGSSGNITLFQQPGALQAWRRVGWLSARLFRRVGALHPDPASARETRRLSKRSPAKLCPTLSRRLRILRLLEYPSYGT